MIVVAGDASQLDSARLTKKSLHTIVDVIRRLVGVVGIIDDQGSPEPVAILST
jgi:hypothetical protein